MFEKATSPRTRIDSPLVRRLIAGQFPQWSKLAIAPVQRQGNDNRTFRLGPDLSVRLPSADRYAAGVEKEQRWLPILAPHLPLPIPEPIALGQPTEFFPRPWSIYRWRDGETADRGPIVDQNDFARSLAEFLVALRGIDATGGPAAGIHSFHRGAPLPVYNDEARAAFSALGTVIDRERAIEVWNAALATAWTDMPVWFHGDVAAGNLLVRDGKLCAVVDFGTCGVGDPACDLVIAWTFLDGEAREIFRRKVALDEATWARGRGWALWKAAIVMASGRPRINHADLRAEQVIEVLISEHRLSK